MSRCIELFRLLFVSPELLFSLVPIVVYYYFPAWGDVLLKPMGEGLGWGLSAAALPLGMLAFCYKEGLDLLSLSGGKKVLIEWPGYPMLKARVLVSFGWCLAGVVSCIVAAWMVAKAIHPLFGVTLLVSGLIAAATATATIALARFSLRELLGE